MRHSCPIKVNVHPIVDELSKSRIAWGFSLEEIARRIGCSYTLLAHVESGQKQPSFKMLARWAEVFGYDVSLTKKASE